MTYCDTAKGSCVGCLMSSQCDAAAPVCDSMTQTCRGCTADAECGSGVCDAAAGTCVAEANVLYAISTGIATSSCTKLDPCTLVKAFSLVDATKNTIKMGSGTYLTGPTITASLPITVYGAGATLKSTMIIMGGANVKIRGLAFLGDGGVYCAPGTVGGTAPTFDLQDVSFDTTGTTQTGPFAIQATACVLDIRRTTFKLVARYDTGIYASGELMASGAPANRGSIVTIDRSSFDGGEPAIGLYNYSAIHLKNSLMFGAVPTFAALGYNDTTVSGTVDFSTFINWSWLSGSGPVRFVASNNLFYDPLHANTNSLTGLRAEHHYDLAFPQMVYPQGTNNMIGMDPMLKDPANKDFHLMTGSPAIDAADPTSTTPVDYEATARPQGVRRDIGAYEYK